jgi:hypothetical protein
MNLSAEDRERIYLEEKGKREHGGHGSGLLMLGLTIGAVMALAVIMTVALSDEKDVSIEDLRKAYPGLSPEEEEQEA